MALRGITRVFADSAGGQIVTTAQAFARCQGNLIAVEGATIASHGSSPHNAGVLLNGSLFFRINGLKVVVEGKTATCGHQATGSTFALVED